MNTTGKIPDSFLRESDLFPPVFPEKTATAVPVFLQNVLKMSFSRMLLSLFCTMTFLSAGEVVSETEKTIVYRQSDGRVVSLRKHPSRVVVAYTSLTQLWYCAGGTAVGIPFVKAKETLPPEARNLPSIGQVTAPNAEKLLALRPSLVLFTVKHEKHRALRGILERSGIESVYLDYTNYSDFLEILDFFCRLNGSSLERTPLAEGIVKEVDSICRKAKSLKPLRFAVLFAASRGFALEKNGVNAAHMLTMLGGKNIVTEPGTSRIPFSLERFLLEDPEIIFIITMGPTGKIQRKVAQELMEQPAWKQLRAVKNGRVHFLPVERYLYLPGMRFPEAFRHLAGLMYPGEEF